MIPDARSPESIGDLLFLPVWGYAIYVVGFVIWLFAAAICSSFLPAPTAGIVGAVIAVAVVIVLVWRNTVNFRCPNCGAFKHLSDQVR
jgi:ABC-type thiamin/hydroxymethylpyrimidine transport system permease subunit